MDWAPQQEHSLDVLVEKNDKQEVPLIRYFLFTKRFNKIEDDKGGQRTVPTVPISERNGPSLVCVKDEEDNFSD